MRRRRPRRDGLRREIEDELAFHFATVVEQLMTQGLPRERAEQEAIRRFGGVAGYRAELERIDRGARVRRAWRERLQAVGHAAVTAARGLRRSPGLSAGVIVAFALGVGANVTMYAIVDRLLLSAPEHIVEPDAVWRLEVDRLVPHAGRRVTGGAVMLEDYERQRGVSQFESVAAYGDRTTVTIGRGEGARRVSARLVTSSFWQVLRVRPELGRVFTEVEDRPGVAGTVVISHELWRRDFGADPSAIGRELDVGRYGAITIIGVAPQRFTGVDLSPVELWLPARQAGVVDLPAECCYYWLNLVARLREGASVAAAEAEATAAHRAGWRAAIERGDLDPDVRIVPTPLIAARGPGRTAEVDVALWLTGVSAVVLLIACVNVANLLIARGIRARRQTGIRLALGITRSRLALEALSEALLLALLGGIGAVLVAQWGGRVVRALLLPHVVWPEGPDAGVFVVAFLLAMLAGVAAGALPVLAALRADVGTVLRALSGGVTRSAARARAALTIAQTALSVVLLLGAVLFVRSLQRVRATDLGFDARRLLLATVEADPGVLEGGARKRYFDDALEALRGRSGVHAVAASFEFPFGNSSAVTLRIEGIDSLPRLPTGGPYINNVSHDYFAAMDLAILRGRGFEATDVKGSPRVAVINEAFARWAWPGEDAGAALGRCLVVGTDAPCTTIVGVAENARRDELIEEPNALYYVAFDQAILDMEPYALLVRTAGDAAQQAPSVRSALLALEPRLRNVNVRPYQQLVDPQLRAWSLGAALFSTFGLLALLVAGTGLYSVLSFDVAQRTREIGLRCALGATAAQVLGLITGRAVRLTAAGIALGLALALLVAPRLRSLLYDTSPYDGGAIVVVAAALLLTAGVASCVPAARAAHVDPNEALRAE